MFRRSKEADAAATLDLSQSHYAELVELAKAGSGVFDPDRIPQKTPNFLYILLAAPWAESNQLFRVDYVVSAELASRLHDDDRYTPVRDDFERLADRTIDSPNRGARLRKMVIDAITGLPDGSDQRSLLATIMSERMGYSVVLRPTAELVETIYRNAFGWGPLEGLMYRSDITEIMVDRYDAIFSERTIPGEGSRLIQEPLRFEGAAIFARFIDRMVEQAGKSLNFEEPTVDMNLPDGSRVNATISPVSQTPSLTIRRKREEFYSLDELETFGSFDAEMHAFLHEANLVGANMMTYGPTGSGKTTLLTALLDDKDLNHRLVIVEDTPEINVELSRHPNTVWMLTNQHRDMRDLVRNALRMRPDHLIVGETRDSTAYDLVQAFNSGQLGSISTIHARDPESALVRLTNLVRQAEAAPTEQPARRMVAEAIHLLVHAARLGDGSRRITRIDEVLTLDSDFNFRVQNIFQLIREEVAADGRIPVRFEQNPDYVMHPSLTTLFGSAGLDPDRWTGVRARAAGLRPQTELV